MRQWFRTKKLYIVTFVLIALMGCNFVSQKEGYHMDELLSFELANAEFTPWIVPTQPQGRLEKYVTQEIYGDGLGDLVTNLWETACDVVANRGASKLLSYQADVYPEPVWITGDMFRDYITVDGRDSFNLFSVYFNVKDDNHPPLHFMAIHLISSVFQGTVSVWMGCLLNLVLILLVCALLVKIGQEIAGGEEGGMVGLCAALLYGCSMAGLSTLLLIRMYAMLTLFCVAVLYEHLYKWNRMQFGEKNRRMILLVLLGFWTQYFFVLYMIFLAATTMVLLLRKKEKRQAFVYGRSMVIAAVLGVLVYPFSVDHVLHSGRGVESVQNLSGFGDLPERFGAFGEILYRETLGGAVGALCFGLLLLLFAVLCLRKGGKIRVGGCGYLLMIPAVGYFLVASKAAPFYEDRYVMPIFPLAALFLALLLYGVWKRGHALSGGLALWRDRTVGRVIADRSGNAADGACSRGCSAALWIAAALLVLVTQMGSVPNYLYKGYRSQLQIGADYGDVPMICVYDGVGYYENLVEFCDHPETLLVTQEELTGRSRDEKLLSMSRLLVLEKSRTDHDAVEKYLQDTYGFVQKELLVGGAVSSPHGDRIYLYEKKLEGGNTL